jgi:hypothetical protein
MECKTKNYWVFGLCPSTGILKTRKQRFGNWICFRPQVRGDTPALLGTLERANLNHWTTHVRLTTAIYMPETNLECSGFTPQMELEVGTIWFHKFST